MSTAAPIGLLADVGINIADLFGHLKVTGIGLSDPSKSKQFALENLSDRFDLWAVNLGLHHSGHSSLDYRLRDADLLQQTIRTLLLDLSNSLTQSKKAKHTGSCVLIWDAASHSNCVRR
jgi:hypothetical protein